MKDLIIELIKKMKSDPRSLSTINQEINNIIKSNNTNELMEVASEETDEIYILIILENKIKLFFNEERDEVEVKNFIEDMLKIISKIKITNEISYKKYAHILSILGVFGWPKCYENFFNTIIEYLNDKNYLGLLILENFTFQSKYSLQINEKRKYELRNAVKCIQHLFINFLYDNLQSNDNNTICTTLKILELMVNIIDIDLHKIIKKEYPELVGSIFLSILEETQIKKNKLDDLKQMLLEFSNDTNPSHSVIVCLNKLNIRNDVYFYKALFDKATFENSLDYFIKNIDIVDINVCNKILIEYPTTEDNLKQTILDFFIKISKSNQRLSLEMINLVEVKNNQVPKKILLQLLKNLDKNITITSQNYFVQAYYLEKMRNKMVMNYIPNLFEDGEDLKIISRLLDNLNLEKNEIEEIYKFIFSGSLDLTKYKKNITDELEQINYNNLLVDIKSKCIMKIGISINFDVDVNTVNLYYYLIKYGYIEINKPNEKYDKIFCNEFYPFFMKVLSESMINKNNTDDINEKTALSNCYEILALLAKKDEINQDVFNEVYKTLEHIKITDLFTFISVLGNFKFRNLFYKNLLVKLIHESENTDEFDILDKCCMKFIQILTNDSEIELLIELLKIDSYKIAMKLVLYLRHKNTEKNLENYVFYLLRKYNSYEYYDLQPLIIISLVKCIKYENSIEVFSKYKSDNIIELKNLCMNSPDKKSKIYMKEYLSDIKASRITELGRLRQVGEQNFLNKGKNHNANGVDTNLQYFFTS